MSAFQNITIQRMENPMKSVGVECEAFAQNAQAGGSSNGTASAMVQPSPNPLSPHTAPLLAMPPKGCQNLPPLPPFDTQNEMWLDEIIPPTEIIRGLIHKGTKTTLVGGSKANKTWSLMDLGLSVASGASWWGMPSTQSRVLYINMEIPKEFARQRLRAIAAAKDITEPSGFVFWNLRGYIRPMSDMIREIIAKIKADPDGFGMIIIDPIYKLFAGRDENGAGDMTELLNELEKLAVETGAAVVNGTHMSKGNQAGKEPMDRASGSGVIARDPDTMIVLTKHDESDAFTVDLVLRNFPPMPSFVIRREHPLMVRADDLNPMEIKQPKSLLRPPKPTPTLEMFMGIFPATTHTSLEESALGNEQISKIFREKGWNADSIKPLKEQALAPENRQLTIRRLAHNRQLFVRPEVLANLQCG